MTEHYTNMLPEAARALARALARSGGPDDDAIARAVADLIDGDGWEPMMAPMIEPIRAAAREARERGETLEQFRERLPALFADMDDAPLVEILHRMEFSAALSGQIGLTDE